MKSSLLGLAAGALGVVAACDGSGDGERFSIRFQGRVLDAGGHPVDVPVRLHYGGEIQAGGQRQLTVDGNVHAEAGQPFNESRWWGTERMLESDALLVGELQASDLFGLYEPSPPRPISVPNGTTFGDDYRLGARRPTVPVRVVDTAGKPVTRYWLLTITEEAPAPQRWGTFADGVAALPIPRAAFRLKAYLERGTRETIVGPFDPSALPTRIDITLPD